MGLGIGLCAWNLGRGARSREGIQKQGKGRQSQEEVQGERWEHPESGDRCGTGRGLGVPGRNTESIGRAQGPGKRCGFQKLMRGHGASEGRGSALPASDGVIVQVPANVPQDHGG